MKLAFSTNAYTRFPLIEALRGIHEAGFRGVEILADVPHAWPEAIDDRMVGEIAQTLENLGIDVGIECEPGLYLEYVVELMEWIGKLGSRRLGANLDIGHSQVIGELIPEVIAMLKGRIWNLHVEDIPGRKHYHMIPGEG